MKKSLNKTVFVGVSGGVDSSVSAALLKDAGYTVVGVFIRTWQPDFIECTWRDERRDAMRVCAHLGIPFLECDAEEAYKNGVADYMIEEYKKGNTPNPDVMCNREVKFGIFWDFAKTHDADFIATGHYAIVGKGVSGSKNSFLKESGGGVPLRARSSNGVKTLEENIFLLERSPDQSKDQSYFLWTLTQEDLEHTLFPVGHLQKTEVRELAEKYKLPTATKKDSQGVCFLGPLDMKEFLKHYIDSKEGDVLDEKGTAIGTHDGAVFLTLGERHGFTITKKTATDTPYYVIGKNIEHNTITVSQNVLAGGGNDTCVYMLEKTNWISSLPVQNTEYTAQVRYHGEMIACTIEVQTHLKAAITFSEPVIISQGQSVVVYSESICMGGGVVI